MTVIRYSAAILCGGKSRRMGEDKASLQWKDIPLAKYKWQQFTGCAEEVFFSVRDPEQGELIRKMVGEGALAVPDEPAGCGPLGGIYASLKHCSEEYLFVTAVDMPFSDPETAQELAALIEGYDAVIPVTADGRQHPLCALYAKTCLPAFEQQLKAGDYKVRDALAGLRVRSVNAADLRGGEKKLTNMNDQSEYRSVLGASVPVYSVIAWSDTGKTTYLEKLIPALRKKGVRVAVIKHDGHDFDIDHPGTDSANFTAAGADISGIFSDSHAALMLNFPVEAEALVSLAAMSGAVDLILTEGCKKGKWPKILLYRESSGKPMAADPDRCAAVVSDVRVDTTAPVFPIRDVDAVADFLKAKC